MKLLLQLLTDKSLVAEPLYAGILENLEEGQVPLAFMKLMDALEPPKRQERALFFEVNYQHGVRPYPVRLLPVLAQVWGVMAPRLKEDYYHYWERKVSAVFHAALMANNLDQEYVKTAISLLLDIEISTRRTNLDSVVIGLAETTPLEYWHNELLRYHVLSQALYAVPDLRRRDHTMLTPIRLFILPYFYLLKNPPFPPRKASSMVGYDFMGVAEHAFDFRELLPIMLQWVPDEMSTEVLYGPAEED